MAHLRDAVGNYLKMSQKFCFHDQWLTDCVDWIKENFGNEASSADRIRELVRDQWLLADLREISPGCLPTGLSEADVGILNGAYTLQVNHVIDVGASAYSQLEKLKGKEIIEEEQNEKSAKKGWDDKPKASRMLMMELTDGTQSLRGMEHHPAACLNVTMAPGCKIRVTGEVRVRRGTLLLNKDNVALVGGQVDDLQEQRSQKKVLSVALGVDADQEAANRPRNNMPPAQASTATGGSRPATTASSTTAAGNGNRSASGNAPASTRHYDPVAMDDNDIEAAELEIAEELEELTRANDRAMPTNRHSTPARNSNRTPSTVSTSKKETTSTGGLPLAERLAKSRVASTATNVPPRQRTPSLDADDEELAVAMAMELDDMVEQAGSSVRSHAQATASRGAATSAHRTVDSGHNATTTTRTRMHSPPGDGRGVKVKSESRPHTRWDHSSPRSNSARPSHDSTAMSSGQRVTMKTEGDASSSTKATSSHSVMTMSSRQPVAAGDGSRARQSRFSDKPATTTTATATGSGTWKPAFQQASSHTAGVPSSRQSAASASASVSAVRRPFSSDDVATSSPAPKRQCSSAACEIPYTYLNVINSNRTAHYSKPVWIKAFLGTLTSRLRNTDGWSVRAIVNDGSDTLEVEFSNELLVNLIGFTTVEQKALYAQAKQMANPAVKSRVLEGIQRCQKVLAALCCFLEIRVSADREYPLVTRMRGATCHDAQLLLESARRRLEQ